MGKPLDLRQMLRTERLEDRTTPSATFESHTAAPHRVLVSFHRDEPAAQLADLNELTAAETVTPLGFGIYSVDLNPASSIDDALRYYLAQPDVATAEPDRIVTLNATLNDPSLVSQSGLSRINTAAAWDRTTGTRNTIVAVIDTGVDYRHPDLAANMWVNSREVPGNGRDDDGNGFTDDVYGYDFAHNDSDPVDDDRHGTHVAGILGAVGNNNVGISGVNPNTRIMALKFIRADGTGYTSDAVRALNYAVANGAKIANASWGGGSPDATLATAINRARDRGVIFVAAAGNDGKNNDTNAFYPANYITTSDNVVTVAATDTSDRLASYSNSGTSTVTLAAPGSSILSTLPNNRYGSLSGTSMATPFVSGALALLWDQNPNWSYRQIVEKLKQSVDPLSSLSGKTITGGRLNVAKLLGATPLSPPVVPPVIPPTVPRTDTVGGRVLSATFSGNSPNSFNKARVTFNEPMEPISFTTGIVSFTGPMGNFSAIAVTPVVGTNNTQFDVFFAQRTQPGKYTMTINVEARDRFGNRLNQNGNGINGEANDRFTTSATLTALGKVSAMASNLPIAIPDGGSAIVPLQIVRDGGIADLKVKIYIEHFKVGDLIVQLRAPDGRIVTLANRRGGNGSGYRETTFDDQAATDIASARSPFAGKFRPEESLTSLIGVSVRGTWALIITDTQLQDKGRITAFGLEFTTTPTAAPTLHKLAFEEQVESERDAIISRFDTATISDFREQDTVAEEEPMGHGTRRLLGEELVTPLPVLNRKPEPVPFVPVDSEWQMSARRLLLKIAEFEEKTPEDFESVER